MQSAVSTGELGSWKYDDEDSMASDGDDQAVATDGVLGLIRQLQKGDDNRTTSGI